MSDPREPAAGWAAPGGPPPGAPPGAPPPAAPGWEAQGWAPQGQPAGPPVGSSPGRPGPPPGADPRYGAWGPPPVAPKPGVVPLRPLGLADILDGAIAYIRRDPRTVLGISAVLSLVIVVLGFLANLATFRSLSGLSSGGLSSGQDVSSTGIGDLSAVLAVIVSLPISILATGLLTVVVGQSVLGRHVSAAQAWRAAKPVLWRLVGLTLLIGLVVGGAVVVGIALAVLLGIVVAQASTGLGVLVGVALGLGTVVVAVWLAVRLLLAPPALLLERCSVTMSMRRSARLVRGSWWRLFGIALLAQVISGLISQVLTVPFALGGTILALMFPQNGSLWWVTLAAVSLGSFLGSVVTMPFTAGVTALQYIDQRIRREGLDLELARAAQAS